MVAEVRVNGFFVTRSLARQSVHMETDMAIKTTPGDGCRLGWDGLRSVCSIVLQFDNLVQKTRIHGRAWKERLL